MPDKKNIATTITNYFFTQVTVGQGVITLFGNAKKPVDATGTAVEQPTNDLWVAVHVIWGDSFQSDMGATTKRYRTVGVMTVQVFTPLGMGDGAALTLIDTIESKFRTITIGDVVFRTPSITPGQQRGSINTRGQSGDNWWQINVKCPFYADNVT